MIYKILIIIVSTLIGHLCLIFWLNSNTHYHTKILIDTDAGGDDAVAIFLALSAESRDKQIKVVAITCTYGNTNEENVEKNVLKILTIANRTDIPVYAGVKKPLIQKYIASNYFGKDGFGDFNFTDKIFDHNLNKKKHAALAMIELAHKYPGELNIIVLGPLTNVALAASIDENFTQLVKQFYIMGSVINELNNTKETLSEFNFSLDPESNYIFLKSKTKLPSKLTNWNVVLNHEISKDWRTHVLGLNKSSIIYYMNKIESVVLDKISSWQPADSITVATMIWPELVNNSVLAYAKAVTGSLGKGAVNFNYNSNQTNVDIIKSFNVTSFKDKLLNYLS